MFIEVMKRLNFIIVLAVLTAACASTSPETALGQFYTYKGPEDTMIDPLILAGDKVVPLVIERVKDKRMPRRRYAIGFLGNGSYRQALPVLREIVQDRSEEDYFRGDALQSIYMIDEGLGLSLAERYKSETDYIGDVAKDLLGERRHVPERRSYFAAWLSRHD